MATIDEGVASTDTLRPSRSEQAAIVAALAADGLTIPEIARMLGVLRERGARDRGAVRDKDSIGQEGTDDMSLHWGPLERIGFIADFLSPRPRKARQITRIAVAVILVVGFFRDETPWEILILALWVGIYVELIARRPGELGGRPW